MVTVRTIKLKRSSSAYGDSGGSGNLASPEVSETGTPPPNVTPSAEQDASLAQGPAPTVAKTNTVPGKSTLWFMLIALFAAIGLLVILGLQYSEMSFFKIEPSVWLPGK